MKSFFQDRRGESIIGGLYMLMVVALLLLLSVEIIGYSMMAWKLRQTSMETLNLMKTENGFNTLIESKFYTLLEHYGVDLGVQVQGTPVYVQRGDLLELKVTSKYEVRCLRPFGRTLVFPIEIRLQGLAHTYLREGGP